MRGQRYTAFLVVGTMQNLDTSTSPKQYVEIQGQAPRTRRQVKRILVLQMAVYKYSDSTSIGRFPISHPGPKPKPKPKPSCLLKEMDHRAEAPGLWVKMPRSWRVS